MRLLILLFLSLYISGCKSTGESAVNEKDPGQTQQQGKNTSSNLEPFYCEEITETGDLADTSTFSTTNILDYELIKGCACIKYEYSGCREGDRMLVWNGEWNESNRPEVLMELMVRNAGQCDQLWTDSTCFSLKKMKLVGNEVLVFLNSENQNLLLDFNTIKN